MIVIAVLRIHDRLCAVAALAIHVAYCNNLRAALREERAHVGAALSANTDAADGDAVARSDSAIESKRRRRHNHRCDGDRTLQEAAARHMAIATYR